MIFKIDLETAYDHVESDFVDYMLLRMGFGETWSGWTHRVYLYNLFSVLINGSPSRLFKASRGIR